ncbi:MAG: FHA domain-containing protein [Candidatus Acidiferrales bacterium]
MPRLVVERTGEGARVFELLGDRPVAIGRTKSSNLLLDHPSVSRTHAVMSTTPDGKWQIVDRDSVNGLRINGVLAKEAVLRPDDQIAIGEYQLRFEDSVTRKLVSCGTAKLPSRFEKVLRESAYAESFTPVEAVAEVAPPAAEKRGSAAERLRALEQENRLLTVLYRVNRSLAEQANVEQVTQRVLDLVLEIDGAERAYAMLLDDESIARGEFTKPGYGFQPAIVRCRGGDIGFAGKPLPQFTISQSIIRQVMQAGLPMLVADGKADPRFSGSESVVQAGIQSAMCAPLGIGKRVRGLLYVDNLSRRGMFKVDDLNVFAVIAVQAGLGIDRVRSRSEAPELVKA